MQHSPNYGLFLIVIVALLSLVAGLTVVVVTGPESLRLASLQQPTVTQTMVVTSTSTVAPLATATSDAPTPPPATATSVVTSTPANLESPTPEATPTVTATYFPTLAPDAVAVGQIVTENNSTARLRSVPGLEGKVIAAMQPGEFVQVLGGKTNANEIDWLPIRLNNGLSGWIAANLVETFP